MGRVESLFYLIRAHATHRFPWIAKVNVRFCKQADETHRRTWRHFAHAGHDSHTICFAKAAELDLTDEEILGICAHELGHIVGTRLRYPEHARLNNPPHWKKPVEEEANRIAQKVLGFSNLRINRRKIQELSVQPVMIYENVGQLPFNDAWREFPKFIGGRDEFSHKTVSDLVFLAQHELDLHAEGEETDIRTSKQLQKVKEYVRKFGVRS